MNPVRKQIIDAVIARYSALAWVGKVIDACESESVEADIAAAIKAGKVVIELTPLSDVSLQEDGIDAGWQVEAFRFDVLAVLLIPPQLVPPGTRPSAVGADYHARLVAEDTGGVGNANGTWGGLARKTETLGGGGVGFLDETSRIVVGEHACTITYYHTRGNPEEPR